MKKNEEMFLLFFLNFPLAGELSPTHGCWLKAKHHFSFSAKRQLRERNRYFFVLDWKKKQEKKRRALKPHKKKRKTKQDFGVDLLVCGT